MLLNGSQALPEGHLRTFRALAPQLEDAQCGWVPSGCSGWMVPEGGVCVQGQGVPGSGVSEQHEWQGRVWPPSSPAAVSKGQCLGVPQLFPAQRDFQKKLLMAISGWALTHPWLGAKGCAAPAMVAPYPITVLLGRQCCCPPSRAAPRIIQSSGEPQAALPKRHQLLLRMYAPYHWAHVCLGVPGRDGQ